MTSVLALPDGSLYPVTFTNLPVVKPGRHRRSDTTNKRHTVTYLAARLEHERWLHDRRRRRPIKARRRRTRRDPRVMAWSLLRLLFDPRSLTA